jgi:hypothetical protein
MELGVEMVWWCGMENMVGKAVGWLGEGAGLFRKRRIGHGGGGRRKIDFRGVTKRIRIIFKEHTFPESEVVLVLIGGLLRLTFELTLLLFVVVSVFVLPL